MKMLIKRVIKRDGSVASFDPGKITQAIHKAMLAHQEGSLKAAQQLTNRVVSALNTIKRSKIKWIPAVEQIQDMVEEKLIRENFPNTAKGYILYRQKHQQLRQQKINVTKKIRELAKKSSHYFQNTLSEVVYLRTYARWIEEEGRRETWIETVNRYMNFMQDNLKNKLSQREYHEIHNAILKQEIMPSMRLMQFAGPAAQHNQVSSYNCAYIAPTSLNDFAEIMYISMCGCGIGFSVESQNIQRLPIIKKQTGKKLKTFVIADSKEGWCKAYALGLKTWYQGKDIKFDFSKLRPLGARLKTSGGRSSGPDPLRALLEFSRNIILNNQGRRLSNIDVYDLICKIGEVVVSGGVRRSAMISLSDLDDQAMRDAKKGQFYYSYQQRSYANNSTVYEEKPTDEMLLEEWLALIKSHSGERGIFNRGNLINSLPKKRIKHFKQNKLIKNDTMTGMIGTNPCGEIILQSKQFCNLSEIIARPHDQQKDLLRKIRLASIVGTFQATLTNFHFLPKAWQQHCEQEALLGVSITGFWDCKTVRNPELLKKLKQHAIKYNQLYAKKFKINPATAVTCVKPSGTVSLVVDSAAGMHPRYSPYYIRRIRIAKTDPLFKLLKDQGANYHPEVGFSSENTPSFVVDFPVAAPKQSIFRENLKAIQQLEFWKIIKTCFTEHNPSVTISIEDEEWIAVLNWLTQNWDIIGGLSFLPKFRDIYQLAPFEQINQRDYEKMMQRYQNIDLSKLAAYELAEDIERLPQTQIGPACE